MERNASRSKSSSDPGWLLSGHSGNGNNEHAKLIAAHDWGNSSLGPIDQWPLSLKNYVSLILKLPTPAVIFWGDDQVQIYNYGYSFIMGPRHPKYLGATYRECWPDTYPMIHPWMRKVLEQGEVIEVDRELFPLTRYGFTEEAYFSFSFVPIRDDQHKIAGILQIVTEMTEKVIADRRSAILRALAAAASPGETITRITKALSDNPQGISFSLTYVFDDSSHKLVLVAQSGLDGHGAGSFPSALIDTINQVYVSGVSLQVDRVEDLLGQTQIGFWKEPTRSAFITPIRRSKSDSMLGVMILGISPRLRFDEKYQRFFESVARETAFALAADRESLARQRAEKERENIQRFFMQAPIPICVQEGPDHVYTLANERYYELIGGRRDIIGMSVRRALPELHGQPFFGLLDRVYQTGEPYIGRAMAARVLTTAGGVKEMLCDVIYQPRRDTEGKVDGIVTIATEVTEQVRAQKEIEKLAERLQEAVRSRDEFLSIASHELKTPVTSLRMQFQMTRRGFKPETGLLPSAERLSQMLDTSMRQVDRLTGLVDDLLDISRIQAGKLTFQFEKVDLVQLGNEVVERFGDQLSAAGSAIEVDAGEDVIAECDRFRIDQVMINLLSNAAKYGSGQPVRIQILRDGEHARIVVQDRGIGIEKAKQAKIFERFERAVSATSITGLGLGLYIVKYIVEAHGGSVQVDSEPGRGSTFTVSIPLRSPKGNSAHS